MGDRANYIIREKNKLTIHYNHWRATHIAADLYLGEKRFLQFVEECQLHDEIMNEPWIEGCVIVDKIKRQVHFWGWQLPSETSVLEYYMSALAKKWDGWNIEFVPNRMYDVERILGIDYISKQEFHKFIRRTKEEIVNDKVEEWTTGLVVIKEGNSLFTTKTGNLNIEGIISYGQDIVPLLRDKPTYDLPNEGDEATDQCVVIDTSSKQLFINESVIGLWEQSNKLWQGFEITMGDFGYIETLRLAGIDTSNLIMPHDNVLEQFKNIVTQQDNFDPIAMAEQLKKNYNDIQINPDFFDNVKPRKSMIDRLTARIRRIFGR